MRLKIALTVTSLIGFFLVGLAGVQYLQRPTDVFMSPNGKYQLELLGDKTRPWHPFRTNSVTAEVISNGTRKMGIYVHTGDWLDSTFDLTYQRFRWHNERVFGFHGVNDHEPAVEDRADSLTLTNKTGMRIAYLNAQFGNSRFLVFDIEPGETQELLVPHGMHPAYVYVDGEFENGLRVEGAGLNFTEKAKKQRKGLFRYCATVLGENVVVNGIGIEGTNFWPNEVTVPAVSVCGD